MFGAIIFWLTGAIFLISGFVYLFSGEFSVTIVSLICAAVCWFIGLAFKKKRDRKKSAHITPIDYSELEDYDAEEEEDEDDSDED